MSYLNSLTDGVHFHTIWAESEGDINHREKIEELFYLLKVFLINIFGV